MSPVNQQLPVQLALGAGLGLGACAVVAKYHPRLAVALPEAGVYAALVATGVAANFAASEASARGVAIPLCLLAETAVVAAVMCGSHFVLRSADDELAPMGTAVGASALVIATLSVGMGYLGK